MEEFDYVISNPPYQDQANSAIFHFFQILSNNIGKKTTLIYPADKWICRSGKGEGLDAFSLQQLNSTNLQQLWIYNNANDIFHNIELHSGISIIITNNTTNNNGIFDYYTEKNSVVLHKMLNKPDNKIISVFNNMNTIIEKVMLKDSKKDMLSSVVSPTSVYGMGSSFIEKNSFAIKCNNDCSNKPIVGDWVKALVNETSGTQGRVAWFWVREEDVPKKSPLINEYNIVVATRNAAGSDRRSQDARIFYPGEIFGDSRYCVASFTTLEEAENFFMWMGTDVIRTLILSSSRRVKNFGVNVPLLKSFKNDNNEIDFSKDSSFVNEQLLHYYDFDNVDISYINTVIDGLGSFSKTN